MRLALTAAAFLLAGGVAMAQTTPSTAGSAPGPTQSQTVAPSASPTPSATPGTGQQPTPGHNSFTQRQAANRMRRAGYTNVSGLKKDDQGIWRATAQKDGNTVNVSLDFKGNVVSQ